MTSKHAPLLLVTCLLLAGCGQKDIHARWFNGDMSLRLHPDGRCVYNSRSTGLVEGVYQYDATAQSPAATQAKVNLTVYLPGRQMLLSAQMLGSERLHLTDLSGGTRDLPTAAVLKRAPDELANSNSFDAHRPLASANAPTE